MSHPVVIIDVMNVFLRAYAAYPQMSYLSGEQVGGAVGFLKMMGKLVRDVRPSRVYCAWEGGGSSKRRAIYPEYKLGRRPEKMNRFYGDDIPDTEENKTNQMKLLLEMLKKVPVCQLYVSDAEGDDLIAYLCKGPLKDKRKIIMSADKDFYQLFDENTWSYSPHKKRYITKQEVFEEMRIPCHNIAMAKALCGDPGDNIPGIKGLGFKTCAKRFPLLSLEKDVYIEDVIAYAQSHRDEAKVYAEVADNEAIIKRNYRLVHLSGSGVSVSQAAVVDKKVANYTPRADRIGLTGIFVREGIQDFDVLDYFPAFDSVMLSK